MRTSILVATACCGLLVSLEPAFAQGTAFSFQGRLANGPSTANGAYDLRFALFDALTAGNQVGNAVTNTPTAVSNGVFTVVLDFGAIFPGADRWLEIGVRTNGNGAFATLSPRQKLTPTPYAITAENVAPGAGLSGTYGGAVTLSNSANQFTGSFTGNGANVANVNAATLGGLSSANYWKTAGNAGANPTNGAFLGTTDNLPLEIRVNSARAMRLEPTTDSPSIVNGASVNSIDPNVQGATIAGGGSVATYGGAFPNRVAAFHGTIGGGLGNLIASNAFESTIAGGNQNTIAAGASRSAIGGGIQNTIQGGTTSATIAAGYGNTIEANAGYSAIGGGIQNTIQSNAFLSTIAGGDGNTIGVNGEYSSMVGGLGNVLGGTISFMGGGSYNNIQSSYCSIPGGTGNRIDVGAYGSVIAGGYGNWIKTNAAYAAIGGGLSNIALGAYSTVPGGAQNLALGVGSLAAGRMASAGHDGAFVWGDGSGPAFSLAANTFGVLATGGAGFVCGTNDFTVYPPTRLSFGSATRQMINLWSTLYGIGVQNSAEYFRSGSDFYWYKGGVHSDTLGDAGGGVALMHLSASELRVNGTFVSASDRNMKENFTPVDARSALEKVAGLPLTQWNYKSDPGTRHLGPMAQDFYAAFAVGPDDKHISMVDADGVALAAIQGLNQKLESETTALRSENAELRQRLETLEKMIRSLKSE